MVEKEYIECPKCKKTIDCSVRFCPWCGTQIPDVLPSGNETAATAEVITPNVTVDSGNKKEKKEGKLSLKWKIYVGVGVLAFIIVFLGDCAREVIDDMKGKVNIESSTSSSTGVSKGLYDDFAKKICNHLKPFNATILSEFSNDNVESIGKQTTTNSKGESVTVDSYLYHFMLNLSFFNREDLQIDLPMMVFNMDDGVYISVIWTITDTNAKMNSAFNRMLVALFEDIDYAFEDFQGEYTSVVNSLGETPKNFMEFYLLSMYGIDLTNGNDELARNLFRYIYANGYEFLQNTEFFIEEESNYY